MSENKPDRLKELGQLFKEHIHDTTSQEDAESIILATTPDSRHPLEYVDNVDKEEFVDRMKSIFRRQ